MCFGLEYGVGKKRNDSYNIELSCSINRVCVGSPDTSGSFWFSPIFSSIISLLVLLLFIKPVF